MNSKTTDFILYSDYKTSGYKTEITFTKLELMEFIKSKQPSRKKLNVSDFWNGYEMALSDFEGFIESKIFLNKES